jgi:hypothetical protein
MRRDTGTCPQATTDCPGAEWLTSPIQVSRRIPPCSVPMEFACCGPEDKAGAEPSLCRRTAGSCTPRSQPPTWLSSCELDCWPVARRSWTRKSKPPGSERKLQRAARAKPAPLLAKVCRGTGIEAGNGESKIRERMPAPGDKASAATPHLRRTAATEIGTAATVDKLALAEARSFHFAHTGSLPTHCFD